MRIDVTIALMHDDFPAPGRSGDDQVGQVLKVEHPRRPCDVLTKGDGKGVGIFDGLGCREDVTECHQLAMPVGDLDADRALARDRSEDAHVRRRKRIRDVVGKTCHARDPYAGSELDLVSRNGRPRHNPRESSPRHRAREGRAPIRLPLLRAGACCARSTESGTATSDGRQLVAGALRCRHRWVERAALAWRSWVPWRRRAWWTWTFSRSSRLRHRASRRWAGGDQAPGSTTSSWPCRAPAPGFLWQSVWQDPHHGWWLWSPGVLPYR